MLTLLHYPRPRRSS